MNYLALIGYHHYFSDHGSNGFIILLSLAILAFEVWMLVDVISNKKVLTKHKVWWVVGMFLLHPFVAIAYFFTARSAKR